MRQTSIAFFLIVSFVAITRLSAFPMDSAEEASRKNKEERNQIGARGDFLNEASSRNESEVVSSEGTNDRLEETQTSTASVPPELIDHETAWYEACKASQDAELARRKDWTLRIIGIMGIPEVRQAITSWERAKQLKQEACEKETDPFQQALLHAEVSWAEAERATWIAKRTEDKAASSLIKQENNFRSQASKEYSAAEILWNNIFEEKQILAIIDVDIDPSFKKELEAEMALAKAKSLICQANAIHNQARTEEANNNVETFEKAWASAIDSVKKVAPALDSVIAAYQTLLSSVLQDAASQKQIIWNDHLEEACFLKALWSIEPFRDEAIKVYKKSHAIENKAASATPKERTAFDAAWQEAFEQKEEERKAFEQLLQQYRDYNQESIPQRWQNAWKNRIDETYFFQTPINVHWLKAQRVDKLANEAQNQAEKRNSTDSDFNQKWNVAILAMKEKSDAWGKVAEAFIQHGVKENNNFIRAQYWKEFYDVRSLWLETQRATAKARTAEAVAMSASSHNKSDWKKKWNAVKRKVKKIKKVWDQVVEAYTARLSAIHPTKLVDWNKHLEEAQYEEARLATASLWVGALKAGEVAKAAQRKVEQPDKEVDPNNQSSKDAREKTELARDAWEAVVQVYKNSLEHLPTSQQENWKKNLKTALSAKAYHGAMHSVGIDAWEKEHLAKEFELKAVNVKFQKDFNDQVESKISEKTPEAAWNEHLQSAQAAVAAWEKVESFITQQQHEIFGKENEGEELNDLLVKARHQKKFFLAKVTGAIFQTYATSFSGGWSKGFLNSKKAYLSHPLWEAAKKEDDTAEDIEKQTRKIVMKDDDSYLQDDSCYLRSDLSLEQLTLFQEEWAKVLEKTQVAELAWDNFIEKISSSEHEPAEERKAFWKEALDQAKYRKAYFAANPLWLRAEEATILAIAKNVQALKIIGTTETGSIPDVKAEEILSAIDRSFQLWRLILEVLERDSQSPNHSEEQKDEWNDYLKTAHSFQEWLEAEKADAILLLKHDLKKVDQLAAAAKEKRAELFEDDPMFETLLADEIKNREKVVELCQKIDSVYNESKPREQSKARLQKLLKKTQLKKEEREKEVELLQKIKQQLEASKDYDQYTDISSFSFTASEFRSRSVSGATDVSEAEGNSRNKQGSTFFSQPQGKKESRGPSSQHSLSSVDSDLTTVDASSSSSNADAKKATARNINAAPATTMLEPIEESSHEKATPQSEEAKASDDDSSQQKKSEQKDSNVVKQLLPEFEQALPSSLTLQRWSTLTSSQKKSAVINLLAQAKDLEKNIQQHVIDRSSYQAEGNYWDQMKDQSMGLGRAWSELLECYQREKNHPPYWIASQWIEELKAAEHKKLFWEMNACCYNTEKLKALTYASHEKMEDAKSNNAAWNAVVEAAADSAREQLKAIRICKNAVQQVSQKFQKEWEGKLEELKRDASMWKDALRYYAEQAGKLSDLNLDSLLKQHDEETVSYIAPAPIDQLSEQEKKSFPGARVIPQLGRTEFFDESDPDSSTVRVRILKTKNKNEEYVRIEELIDPRRGLVNRRAMLANSLLVKATREESIEDFKKRLNLPGSSLELVSEADQLYCVKFPLLENKENKWEETWEKAFDQAKEVNADPVAVVFF